jgi:hypothetical protein
MKIWQKLKLDEKDLLNFFHYVLSFCISRKTTLHSSYTAMLSLCAQPRLRFFFWSRNWSWIFFQLTNLTQEHRDTETLFNSIHFSFFHATLIYPFFIIELSYSIFFYYFLCPCGSLGAMRVCLQFSLSLSLAPPASFPISISFTFAYSSILFLYRLLFFHFSCYAFLDETSVHTRDQKISLYLLTRSLYLTWFVLNNEVHQYRRDLNSLSLSMRFTYWRGFTVITVMLDMCSFISFWPTLS